MMILRESVKRLKNTGASEKAGNVLTATTESEPEKLDESRLAGWQESEAPELLVGYLARIKWGQLLTSHEEICLSRRPRTVDHRARKSWSGATSGWRPRSSRSTVGWVFLFEGLVWECEV